MNMGLDYDCKNCYQYFKDRDYEGIIMIMLMIDLRYQYQLSLSYGQMMGIKLVEVFKVEVDWNR